MKSTIKYLPLLTLLFLSPGCDTVPPETNSALTILIDLTDPLSNYLNSDEIIAHLGLKENIWQGTEITISYISDKDVNETKAISLEKENWWTGNTMIRQAKVAHFIKELRQALAPGKSLKSLDHSIIYRNMAQELNQLSVFKANSKSIMIYSDLMENDEVDFYDSQTTALLKNNPDSIRHILEKEEALGDLSDINIWLLYEPATYEANNTYMAIAKFYERFLESKGAKVYIAKTLNPLP